MIARIAFNLFILCLLYEVGWFGKIQQQGKTNHQIAFRRIINCLIIATYAKLIKYIVILKLEAKIAILIEDFAVCVFYCCLVFIGAFFYEISYAIVNQDSALNKRQKRILLIPCFVITIFFMLNPILHHIFEYADKETVVVKPLFYIQLFCMTCYCLPAFVNIFRNNKYLPSNLIKCTITLIVLWGASILAIVSSGQDDIVLSAFAIGITVLLFALLSYDKFWDERMKMLNKRALYTYLDNCVEKRITSTIFMIKIIGYQFFDEENNGTIGKEIILEMRSMLQKFSPVKNLYYVGGGRIIIVVDSKDKVEENAVLEKLRKNCDRSQELNGGMYSLNIDIYVLHMPEDLKSVEQLKQFLKYNTEAVQTRDMEERVHIYQGTQLNINRALRVKRVEEAIARAIEQKSFQVYYQPIYSINDKEIHSAEALIRLIDGEMGFIPPDEFIPIAEKNGMIMEIGLQVFEQVCQFWHNESLKEHGISYIEVNLSMEQFMDDLLYYKLQSIMEKYEVPKSALNLEITETATMYEEVKLRRQMKLMSEKGFKFSLDDYGTGYSNMESVIEYPLTLVKLDKSIVWSAQKNDKSMITMQSLIKMFHSLGMKIVAEGVETNSQHQMLEDMGGDYIQGYYYSKPLPKDDFINYVDQYRQNQQS